MRQARFDLIGSKWSWPLPFFESPIHRHLDISACSFFVALPTTRLSTTSSLLVCPSILPSALQDSFATLLLRPFSLRPRYTPPTTSIHITLTSVHPPLFSVAYRYPATIVSPRSTRASVRCVCPSIFLSSLFCRMSARDSGCLTRRHG